MCIIFNEEGLKDVDPPCVAQTFISHGALLYKVLWLLSDLYFQINQFWNGKQNTCIKTESSNLFDQFQII